MEENPSLSKIVTDYYQAFSDLLRNIASLVVTEAKQVKWAVTRMAVTVFVVIVSTLFTWLGLCSMLFILLSTYGFSLIYSAFFVFTLNLLLMILAITYLQILNKNALFPATSRQLALAMQHRKETSHE